MNLELECRPEALCPSKVGTSICQESVQGELPASYLFRFLCCSVLARYPWSTEWDGRAEVPPPICCVGVDPWTSGQGKLDDHGPSISIPGNLASAYQCLLCARCFLGDYPFYRLKGSKRHARRSDSMPLPTKIMAQQHSFSLI